MVKSVSLMTSWDENVLVCFVFKRVDHQTTVLKSSRQAHLKNQLTRI